MRRRGNDQPPPRPSPLPALLGMIFLLAVFMVSYMFLCAPTLPGKWVLVVMAMLAAIALPPVALAVFGAWLGRWWITVGLVGLAWAAIAAVDIANNPFGLAVLIPWLRGNPPPGMRYSDEWTIFILLALLPYAMAVAGITHGCIVDWRRWRIWKRIDASGCWKCGYSLVGNTSDRCPECGASIAEIDNPPA